MKNKFFRGVLALALFAFMIVASNDLKATEGDGSQKATCYSTYTTGGNTVIWRCGSCQSVSNANTYSDSGECKFPNPS